MTEQEIERCLERLSTCKTTDVMNFDYAGTLAYIKRLKSENAALINEADENAALSMENKQRADRLEAENAALRERIENAVERLKAREQSVCFGWEWKGVVTDKDIDEVFGVTESSLEEPEGGK